MPETENKHGRQPRDHGTGGEVAWEIAGQPVSMEPTKEIRRGISTSTGGMGYHTLLKKPSWERARRKTCLTANPPRQ